MGKHQSGKHFKKHKQIDVTQKYVLCLLNDNIIVSLTTMTADMKADVPTSVLPLSKLSCAKFGLQNILFKTTLSIDNIHPHGAQKGTKTILDLD